MQREELNCFSIIQVGQIQLIGTLIDLVINILIQNLYFTNFCNPGGAEIDLRQVIDIKIMNFSMYGKPV